MGVAPGLEGLLEDEVATGVIGNHNILVARAGLDGEPSCVVHVAHADGVDADKDLIGWEVLCLGGISWYEWGWHGGREFGLGQADILVLLGQMTHDGIV